jgi:hypothetical protein
VSLRDHDALRNPAGDNLKSITFSMRELLKKTPSCDEELRSWTSFVSDVNEYLIDEYDTELEQYFEDLVVETFVATSDLANHCFVQLQNPSVLSGSLYRLAMVHEASHDCTAICHKRVVFQLRYRENFKLPTIIANAYSVRSLEDELCLASAPRWVFDTVLESSSDKEGTFFCVEAPDDERSYELLLTLAENIGLQEAHDALTALLP